MHRWSKSAASGTSGRIAELRCGGATCTAAMWWGYVHGCDMVGLRARLRCGGATCTAAMWWGYVHGCDVVGLRARLCAAALCCMAETPRDTSSQQQASLHPRCLAHQPAAAASTGTHASHQLILQLGTAQVPLLPVPSWCPTHSVHSSHLYTCSTTNVQLHTRRCGGAGACLPRSWPEDSRGLQR
jgi:hypothetical protein